MLSPNMLNFSFFRFSITVAIDISLQVVTKCENAEKTAQFSRTLEQKKMN